jgi:hypothetical protein
MQTFRIKKLKSRVTITSQSSTGPLHGNIGPTRPSLQFAQAPPAPRDGTMNLPEESGTEGKGSASQSDPISAKNIDPKKVSDRVYDLMKEDLIISRMRRGTR